jgi:hypothetical protein
VLPVDDETLEVIVQVETPASAARTLHRTVAVGAHQTSLVFGKIMNVGGDQRAAAEACAPRQDEAELR